MKKPDEIKQRAIWVESIRVAMGALNDIEMDESIRRTIARCLRAEYASATERLDDYIWSARQATRWTEDDTKILAEVLSGRVAGNWSEEKMNILEASLKLQRSTDSVKKKAIELGFARAVDYWMNSDRK